MLETNKPYMFGSSTTTTTTTSTSTQPPVSQSSSSSRPMDHLPGLQQQRPMHHTNFYSTSYGRQEEEQQETTQDHYGSYHGQPVRLNSAFGRHHENNNNYTYKPTHADTNSTFNTSTTTNTRPLVYSSTPPPPTIIKREEPTLIIPPPPPPPSSQQTAHAATARVDIVVEETESSWFDSTTTTTTATNTSTSVVHTEGVYTDSSDNKRIKRRKEMTSKMEKLNLDFLEKKDGLYTEKLILVNTELKEAHLDTHTYYLDGLRNLESIRQKMIDDGILFREYQKQVTDNQFQLEIYQAEEEYTAETQEIREKLFTVLEEKRRKLKEDKDNCDLAYDVVMESNSRMHKRNLRKRGPENAENKANKRKQMNGPALIFRLKDEDIHADMQAMRSGLSTPPLKKAVPTNKKK